MKSRTILPDFPSDVQQDGAAGQELDLRQTLVRRAEKTRHRRDDESTGREKSCPESSLLAWGLHLLESQNPASGERKHRPGGGRGIGE